MLGTRTSICNAALRTLQNAKTGSSLNYRIEGASHQEGKQCLNINKYLLSVHISNSLTNIKCREFDFLFNHLNICIFKVPGLAGKFYVNLTQNKTNFERTSIEEMPSGV